MAIELAEAGAPIAPPLPETEPVRDDATGFVVTLWRRLEADEPRDVAAADVGGSLLTLHRHLARYKGDLPSFRGLIDLARGALGVIPALSEGDRSTLCRAMDTLSPRIDDFDFEERPLHGEPHLGNLLVTPAGLRWIDFEDVSLGPVEWDLAFLPEDVVSTFDRLTPTFFGCFGRFTALAPRRGVGRGRTSRGCCGMPGITWNAWRLRWRSKATPNVQGSAVGPTGSWRQWHRGMPRRGSPSV